MKIYKTSRLFLTAAFSAGFLLSSPALAGFEFTAPAGPAMIQPMDTGMLPPIDSDIPLEPIAIEPMPSQVTIPETQQPPAQPMPISEAMVKSNDRLVMPPQMPLEPLQPIMESKPSSGMMSLAPQSIQPEPVMREPIIETPVMPAQQQMDFEMAVGFGENLPLVSALRQVVPPNYTFALGKNVNAGQTVSWNGGQIWPTVLNNMIEPLGLSAALRGSVVVINTSSSNMIQPMSPQESHQNNSMFSAEFRKSESRAIPVISDMPETSKMLSMPIEPKQIKPHNAMPPLQQPMAQIPMQLTPQKNTIMMVETSDIPEEEKNSIIPDEVMMGQWTAPRGSSLKTVLESWSDLEGVDLFWSSEFDYILAGDVNINGTYEDAVQTLLDGFSQAEPKPQGRLHPNLPNGPAVLVIEANQAIG